MLTRVVPLGQAAVTERGGELYLAASGQLPEHGDHGQSAQSAQVSGQPGGNLTEARRTDVTETVELPGPDQPVSFAAHIRPLFRERDQQSMSWAFDLGSYDDVRAHAAAILDRLAAGSMPCDGAWPAEWVDVFRRWEQTGMQP